MTEGEGEPVSSPNDDEKQGATADKPRAEFYPIRLIADDKERTPNVLAAIEADDDGDD